MQIDHVTREDFMELKALLIEIKESLNGKVSKQEDKTWLKSVEVRKLLGISPGTLQNLRVNGSLPFRKIGGSMYYKLSDIHQLMEGGDDGK
ncbi:helix-turn-helix domain-containing protein [Sphingobacterium paludis]|uniref:Helix-turn-helix protein n=1 Tax=Sphingobacterium paludis TaxID=1476465 RepID=A0A4R7CT91_9SPHI|nr:helix-turn-helix domain-containing protein [Sphingobacterium paludis]TDS09816.1 helix-turn-helix protein [Sphingobacterium paludis]